MSNPPSPLADLLERVTDLASWPRTAQRRLAAGDVREADVALRQLILLAGALRDDLASLEPAELAELPPKLPVDPPDGPAKVPSGGLPVSQAHLGRRQGASVDATPESGYADEPLF